MSEYISKDDFNLNNKIHRITGIVKNSIRKTGLYIFRNHSLSKFFVSQHDATFAKQYYVCVKQTNLFCIG